jgi:hypothetical protein
MTQQQAIKEIKAAEQVRVWNNTTSRYFRVSKKEAIEIIKCTDLGSCGEDNMGTCEVDNEFLIG